MNAAPHALIGAKAVDAAVAVPRLRPAAICRPHCPLNDANQPPVAAMTHGSLPAASGATRLLLVDDEASIREPLRDYLSAQGFAVHAAADAAAARAALAGDAFDLIICDIMMPGEDGLSLTRSISVEGGAPVILLTARAEETERVIGLEIGADDYVVKPFSPRELVARIRAVLRRAQDAARRAAAAAPTTADAQDDMAFANWTFRPQRRCLLGDDGAEVALTAGEAALLVTFLRHPRQILSRERLLDLVRGRDADVFDRSIDNLVSRLRRKLADDPREPAIIKTVWGGGYTLAVDVRRGGE